MTRLALAFAVLATPALSCEITPDSGAVLIGSHHVGATRDFESGYGLFLGWECGAADLRAGVISNSFGNAGYVVTARHDALSYDFGHFEAGLFAGFAHYPEMETQALEDMNGTFPMVGIEATSGPLFAQWIPAANDMQFDSLVTFGLRGEW